MTEFNDIPHAVVLEILKSRTSDVRTAVALACTNKEYKQVIKPQFNDVLYELIRKNAPDFLNVFLSYNVCFCNTDINVSTLYDFISNLIKVSNMEKRKKYQHLLKRAYDGTLFRIVKEFDDEDSQHVHEMSTMNTLIALFRYVKENHDILKQPNQKTNLTVWAMLPLFEYIALSLSHDQRKSMSYFLMDDITDTIVDRILTVKRELKSTRDCSNEIRYRLGKVLRFLCEVYNIEDG